MIVVAGGTGILGTRLVCRLVERGERVRILTRDPANVEHLADLGVEVAVGDVRNPHSLVAAVAGADTVISAVHGFVGPGGVSPATVDDAGNGHLIAAAARARAAFVLVSVVGASPNHPMDLFRAKHAAEQALMASGARWTIVRSTSFIETWGRVMGEQLHATGKVMVFGRGDNPINFVSATDVSALVELATLDPSLAGRVVEIGGSKELTFNQLAALLQEVTGRRGQVRHIPRAMLRIMAVTAGPVRPTLARQARAAVVMDTTDMTFDPTPIRQEFPNLPDMDLAVAIKQLLTP